MIGWRNEADTRKQWVTGDKTVGGCRGRGEEKERGGEWERRERGRRGAAERSGGGGTGAAPANQRRHYVTVSNLPPVTSSWLPRFRQTTRYRGMPWHHPVLAVLAPYGCPGGKKPQATGLARQCGIGCDWLCNFLGLSWGGHWLDKTGNRLDSMNDGYREEHPAHRWCCCIEIQRCTVHMY